MSDDIKPDPAMPSVTLRLSEWFSDQYGDRRRVWIISRRDCKLAVYAGPRGCDFRNPISGEYQSANCSGVEDGMRIADEMLRKWIEEAGE